MKPLLQFSTFGNCNLPPHLWGSIMIRKCSLDLSGIILFGTLVFPINVSNGAFFRE